jgi:hypothetical protein
VTAALKCPYLHLSDPTQGDRAWDAADISVRRDPDRVAHANADSCQQAVDHVGCAARGAAGVSGVDTQEEATVSPMAASRKGSAPHRSHPDAPARLCAASKRSFVLPIERPFTRRFPAGGEKPSSIASTELSLVVRLLAYVHELEGD